MSFCHVLFCPNPVNFTVLFCNCQNVSVPTPSTLSSLCEASRAERRPPFIRVPRFTHTRRLCNRLHACQKNFARDASASRAVAGGPDRMAGAFCYGKKYSVILAGEIFLRFFYFFILRFFPRIYFLFFYEKSLLLLRAGGLIFIFLFFYIPKSSRLKSSVFSRASAGRSNAGGLSTLGSRSLDSSSATSAS